MIHGMRRHLGPARRAGFTCLLVSCLAASLSSVPAAAEQLQRFCDLEVHYMVLNSTSVSADMAARYDLVRGEDRGLVNIAGRRMQEDGSTTPVALEIRGTRRDLLGREIPIEWQEVSEPGATYYLHTYPFTDREAIRFALDVTDTETGRTHRMEFQKVLWRQ